MQEYRHEYITSNKNQHVQHIRELLAKRASRETHESFIIEGVRLSEEAIQAGYMPRLVMYSEDCSPRGMELVNKAHTAGSKVFCVKKEVLDALSGTESTQGILMAMPMQPLLLPEDINFLVILDQLRDPGNLGTILRSSVAAGAQAVLFTPGSVDAWSPKVVRSAMGAHFHLPVHQMEWQAIHAICKKHHLRILLAESGGGTSLWQADLRQPLALVIGGEAEGASSEVKRGVDENLNIPMPGGFESLNAAVAASILLFEVVRQRNS